MKIDIKKIFPNPEQPRKDFDAIELESLAESIRQHGLINPISLEGPLDGDIYILVDGERRVRAAKLAGLEEIEASIRAPMNGNGPRERLTLALVANLQRADMNPIDEAEGYQHMRELGYSVEHIANLTGVNKSNINMKLGFLTLPREIQTLIAQHQLPINSQVTAALKSLPEDRQVSMARSLAAKNSTIKTIIGICKRISNASRAGFDRPIARGKTPMSVLAQRYSEPVETGHWNMVDQVKALELSGELKQAAQETCEDCALYEDASERVCRDCPGVALLRRLAKKTGKG